MPEPTFLGAQPPADDSESRSSSGVRSGVWCVAVSPEDRLLAAGVDDGAVLVWVVGLADVEAGLTAPLLTGLGHDGAVRGVAFSPIDRIGEDGPYHLLASGGVDSTVRLWHIGDDRLNQTYTDHESSVLAVAFSPDGTLLASASEDTSIVLRDLSADTSRQIPGHDSSVLCIAFSPTGDRIVSGGADGVVKLRDTGDGRVLRELRPDGLSPIWNAAFVAGLEQVAFSSGRFCGVWDLGRDEITMRWSDPLARRDARVYAVACRPDGAQLATSFGADVGMLTPEDPIVNLRRAHSGAVHHAAYLADGRLATGGADGFVHVWESRKHVTKPVLSLQAIVPQ